MLNPQSLVEPIYRQALLDIRAVYSVAHTHTSFFSRLFGSSVYLSAAQMADKVREQLIVLDKSLQEHEAGWKKLLDLLRTAQPQEMSFNNSLPPKLLISQTIFCTMRKTLIQQVQQNGLNAFVIQLMIDLCDERDTPHSKILMNGVTQSAKNLKPGNPDNLVADIQKEGFEGAEKILGDNDEKVGSCTAKLGARFNITNWGIGEFKLDNPRGSQVDNLVQLVKFLENPGENAAFGEKASNLINSLTGHPLDLKNTASSSVIPIVPEDGYRPN